MSLDQQSEVSYGLFLLYAQLEDYQMKLKRRCLPIQSHLLHLKFFQKPKSVLQTSLTPSFLVWYLKKSIFMLYSINWPNFIIWLPLILGILGNNRIVLICFSVCDVINNFLIKSLLYMLNKKSGPKFKQLKNREFLR